MFANFRYYMPLRNINRFLLCEFHATLSHSRKFKVTIYDTRVSVLLVAGRRQVGQQSHLEELHDGARAQERLEAGVVGDGAPDDGVLEDELEVYLGAGSHNKVLKDWQRDRQPFFRAHENCQAPISGHFRHNSHYRKPKGVGRVAEVRNVVRLALLVYRFDPPEIVWDGCVCRKRRRSIQTQKYM